MVIASLCQNDQLVEAAANDVDMIGTRPRTSASYVVARLKSRREIRGLVLEFAFKPRFSYRDAYCHGQ